MSSSMNALVAAVRVPRSFLGLGVIALVGLVTLGAVAARSGTRRSSRS